MQFTIKFKCTLHMYVKPSKFVQKKIAYRIKNGNAQKLGYNRLKIDHLVKHEHDEHSTNQLIYHYIVLSSLWTVRCVHKICSRNLRKKICMDPKNRIQSYFNNRTRIKFFFVFCCLVLIYMIAFHTVFDRFASSHFGGFRVSFFLFFFCSSSSIHP